MEGVKCDCGLMAELKTSHTPSNPDRDFYRCSKSKCRFWSWADALQPTQNMGTPSPATSWAPASSTTPYRPVKRTASSMEEPSDFPQASPSQKRTRLMDAALGAGGSSGGTPSRARNIDPPQASPPARLNANNIAFPQTPTRSAKRSAIYSPTPDPFDFEPGSQQSTASTTQDDNRAYALESGELTPDSIENMVNVLGNIPDYIRKLGRKLIAAEKSRDARTKKIEYLEDEVKRLRDRQKELELIIAGYEARGV